MRADQIIIEPVLTEKTNALRELEPKKYVFRVHADANKSQILQAVVEKFNVKPVSCAVVSVVSKPKTRRTKSGVQAGKTSPWKKAIITLKKGDSISIFDGV